MFLKEIQLDELLDIMKNLCVKKSIGYDQVPPKIIKRAPNLLLPILSTIFNKCINIGYYSNAMKVAKVDPIYKNGEKDSVYNYRQMSILSRFNQLFERLLSNRLLDFFNKFDLFT